MATISLNSNIIRSATMMENQFSFLLTLFLLSKFLKQVLITFTMISWFDGASIINTCNDPIVPVEWQQEKLI